MILKLLLIIGVIGVVYFFFIKKKPSENKIKKNTKTNENLQSSDLVECSSCGVYASIEDSIISSNKYYCSKECVDKSL